MKPSLFFAALCCFLFLSSSARANDPVRLQEVFSAGYQYRVSSRVDLAGKLNLPAEKGKPGPRTLEIAGKSAIDYDERILALDKEQRVHKAIRLFQRIEFQRKIGGQTQQYQLRPEIKRMVLLRHNQLEIPFSPDGPLTWGEIDLVRTDVFTPALTGLLPAGPVRPGDRWPASSAALQEMTDLEKIDQGSLTCTFDSFTELAKRKHARIALRGAVRGLGEDGPGQHHLDGFFLFDLESNHLSYLSLKGTHYLLDREGKELGKVEGHFVLTRQPHVAAREIADAGLRGLVLEPNDDNTQLLYDNAEQGVKFLYPRRWRIAGVNGRQITLDEPRGSGVLLTLEAPAKVPTGAQFMQEVRNWLAQQKATLGRQENPRQIQGGANSLEWFGLEAEVKGQKAWLDYWIVRQAQGGATVAGRLMGDVAGLQRDVQRLVRSMQFTRPPQ